MNRKAMLILVVGLLLVLTIAIDAMAYVNDSTKIALPIVFNNYFEQDSPLVNAPTGTLAVFASSATTNGNAGGRSGMNAICNNEDPDSHFCALQEIENTLSTTGVFFATPFTQAWLDNVGNSGTLHWFYDSCQGWTYDNSGGPLISGYTVWDDARQAQPVSCSEYHSVTCCKWGP